MTDKTCKARVKEEWKSTKTDLEAILKYEQKGKEHPELGPLSKYGLSLDKVEAGTFKDQRADYIRYQFSWGGPSDELRIFKNGDLEYWFLDWFDGASLDVTDDPIAQEIASYCLDLINW